MDKAIVGYENKLVFHIIQHSPLEFFAPKSLVNNKLLLGLSFIAGKLTFDTQIYWGMSVVIKDDLFYISK